MWKKAEKLSLRIKKAKLEAEQEAE